VLPALLVGCRAEPVRPDLTAVDAESRIAGIVAAAESDDPADLPLLVEALDDDDAAVRLFAIEALERRTGQTHGYSPYAPPAERAEAVDRWRAALERVPELQTPDAAPNDDPVTAVAEKEGASRE
jgi:HEAT repeat protein